MTLGLTNAGKARGGFLDGTSSGTFENGSHMRIPRVAPSTMDRWRGRHNPSGGFLRTLCRLQLVSDDVYAGHAKRWSGTNSAMFLAPGTTAEHRVSRRWSAQALPSVRRARSAWICMCVSLVITSRISPSVPMTNVVRLTGLMNERRPWETPYARATEPSLSDSSG